MKLKNLVGFSLIAFIASSSILVVVGLVLANPTLPAAYVPDATPVSQTDGTPATSPGASPAPVYCSGKQPCYGKSALAAHTTTDSCWGYNLDWVLNLTGYAPLHPNGPKYVVNTKFCGGDVHGGLDGSVAVDYTHKHNANTQANSAGTIMASYRVGYYDPNKP